MIRDGLRSARFVAICRRDERASDASSTFRSASSPEGKRGRFRARDSRQSSGSRITCGSDLGSLFLCITHSTHTHTPASRSRTQLHARTSKYYIDDRSTNIRNEERERKREREIERERVRERERAEKRNERDTFRTFVTVYAMFR